MVVWVFAGGGEAEVKGLILFLEKFFPGCRFERKTPIRQKPGSKPNRGYGRTGHSLISQIAEELPIALQGGIIPDLILVFDDLDCRNPQIQEEKFLQEIEKIIEKISACANIKKFVGFAAPELEAWIIADWDNSIAKHSDFRRRHEAMRWWLSQEANIPFDNPESFSEYDSEKDSCREKLSELIIQSTIDSIKLSPGVDFKLEKFKKSIHTSYLLLQLDVNVVQKKCPLFRKLYIYLSQFCSLA